MSRYMFSVIAIVIACIWVISFMPQRILKAHVTKTDAVLRTIMWYQEPLFSCGDANGDATVDVGDVVYIINYVFKGGPAPDPLCVGDANGDGAVDVGDAVYLINYIFKGGPPPVEGCCG